jgi:P pilus assembly chaperone PapD
MMNKFMKISTYKIAIVAIFLCNSAHADMVLDRSIVIIDSKSDKRQDIAVINTDETNNLYVDIELFNVESPGTPEQKLKKPDPSGKKEFITTPAKLVVPPGERKLVRFLNLVEPGDKERLYRINFTPIVKPLELARPASDKEGNLIRPGIQLVVAYQVLVIVLPDKPVHQLKVNRDGKSAVFSNNGNANVLLFDGSQCDPENKSECKPVPGFRLYPGNTRTVELPYNSPLSFRVRSHQGVQQVLYD